MGIRTQIDTFDWDRLRELAGDTVLLSFSCGKDSLACWVTLRDHGFRVIPYYLQLVPGLEFVEHSLRYYESLFGESVHRCTHPNLYRQMHDDWYQPPGRVGVIERLELPLFGYDDVADGVRRSVGLPDAWQAIGTRKAESVMRAKRMKADGLNHTRRTCTPIMDWRKADVLHCLATAGVPLPIDYDLFGRSFGGLYARYLRPIQKRFPRDYARIMEWFPMADVELTRYEIGRRHADL